MSRTTPLPPLSSLPLDLTALGAGGSPAEARSRGAWDPLRVPDLVDSFGQAPTSQADEGPIFLCGLDDLLIRLESSPDYHPSATSGDTLEALTDLLVDAGITR
jgi:hypothetical protein